MDCKFLIDTSAIIFGSFEFDGIKSPYKFVLPRPTPFDFLSRLSNDVKDVKIFHKDRINIIGIPNSGIPISTAIGLGVNKFNKDVYMSVFDPIKMEKNEQNERYTNILIDNSVKTGETILEVISQLNELNYNIDFVFTLFNREEKGRDYLFRSKYPKLPIVYLYSILDIIQFLEHPYKDNIIQHLELYGNHNAKNKLKEL